MKAKSSSTDWFLLEDICVSEIIIIGSDNGLSPSRRQAIIWTNAGILLIGPLGTNFSEILIGIHTFSFKKMHLKLSSGKWGPFCLGLNVLMCPASFRSPVTVPLSTQVGWCDACFGEGPADSESSSIFRFVRLKKPRIEPCDFPAIITARVTW